MCQFFPSSLSKGKHQPHTQAHAHAQFFFQKITTCMQYQRTMPCHAKPNQAASNQCDMIHSNQHHMCAFHFHFIICSHMPMPMTSSSSFGCRPLFGSFETQRAQAQAHSHLQRSQHHRLFRRVALAIVGKHVKMLFAILVLVSCNCLAYAQQWAFSPTNRFIFQNLLL